MELEKVLHMNGGAGQHSYANSSLLQKTVLMKSMPVIEDSLRNLCQSLQPECLMMADMGCSSGPNTFLMISEIIHIIGDECKILKQGAPNIGVYLNDLLGNDFNNLFSMIPSFYKNLEEEKGSEFGTCFVSGTPRSFYGRVFPDQFIHFVYSSYSIHWLSQIPQELINEDGVGLNKGNVCIAKTSPPEIQKAYYSQFKKDFTLFLRSRAKEMVTDGRMVLTLRSRISNKDSDQILELLGHVLHSMVLEGLIDEEKLDSFNIPLYPPTAEEVRDLVEAEGSFALDRLESFTVDWSFGITQSLDHRAQFVAKTLRAVTESLLESAFGKAIIDDVFSRLDTMVKERMTRERGEHYNIVVSMTKKGYSNI